METTDLSIKETALQEQISEKRTQLSGLYLSLGQKYYEFHRNDAEPAMQSAVEQSSVRETGSVPAAETESFEIIPKKTAPPVQDAEPRRRQARDSA